MDILFIPFLIIGIFLYAKPYEVYHALPIKKEGKEKRQKDKEEDRIKYTGIFLIITAIAIFLIGTVQIMGDLLSQ